MANWKRLFRDPKGHDVFENTDPESPFYGRLSVSDKSGADPDNTDDGPLYLQESEPYIYATRSGFSVKVDAIIGRLQDDGGVIVDTEESEVAVNEPLAQWLQDHRNYELQFACDKRFYIVTTGTHPDTVVYCTKR